MPRHSVLRASDADRDQVAERLRTATAEGRLLAEELEDRLGHVFRARTYGELEAVVADLPAERTRRSRPPVLVQAGFAVALAMAVVAVVALAALVLIGLAGAWVAWMIIAWLFLGRRGRPVRRMGRSGRAAIRARAWSADGRVPGGGRGYL